MSHLVKLTVLRMLKYFYLNNYIYKQNYTDYENDLAV